ncbi:DUF2474 family protein [Amylibacter sp. SFDW26]|nr:DUF2474 family protein [Amylibacter sp. SFDW26]KAB7613720.1 DUF2474 family protein [Amylibacter sp. SFDW26]
MVQNTTRKLLWFIAIWCASVTILGIVAYAIKLVVL